MKVGPALFLASITLASSAAAQTWQRYSNEAVRFSIELPLDTFQIVSEGDARLTLDEIAGSARLDVFGVTNPDRLTVSQFQVLMEAADADRTITYRAEGESWFVFSGFLTDEAEPTIFYAKFMLSSSGTKLSAFEISYPAADRLEFDRTVERIEDSLASPT